LRSRPHIVLRKIAGADQHQHPGREWVCKNLLRAGMLLLPFSGNQNGVGFSKIEIKGSCRSRCRTVARVLFFWYSASTL
jgi:hypothetical protein